MRNTYTHKKQSGNPVMICSVSSWRVLSSETVLADNGVCRVHGGGFAGTIQAFVKNEAVKEYQKYMNQIYGTGSCSIFKIRNIIFS